MNWSDSFVVINVDAAQVLIVCYQGRGEEAMGMSFSGVGYTCNLNYVIK